METEDITLPDVTVISDATVVPVHSAPAPESAAHLPTPQIPPGLARRLVEAQKNVRALIPDGWNEFHKYSYPTIAQVRRVAGEALANAGIACFPQMLQVGRAIRTAQQGKQMQITVVKMAFHLVSEEGQVTLIWYGESEDVSDKGPAKAGTSAAKSFFQNLLQMSVADESDDVIPKQALPQQAPTRPKPSRRASPPPAPQSEAKPTRPLEPEKLRNFLQQKAAMAPPSAKETLATQAQVGLIASKLEEALGPDAGEEERHAVLEWLWGEPSAKKLTMAKASATIDWLLKPDSDKAGSYDLHPAAYEEAQAVLDQCEL